MCAINGEHIHSTNIKVFMKGALPLLAYTCQCMVEWHKFNSTLSNSQQVGIVTIAFHLHQCMVEWHESHSS